MLARHRWFVLIGFIAVVGIATAVLATAGRFFSRPEARPTAGVLQQQLSHVVSVNGWMAYDPNIAREILSAGGTVEVARALSGPHQPPVGMKVSQDAEVTVTAMVTPSPLREDSDAKVQVDVKVNIAPTLKIRAGLETVRLESDSFKIKPSDPRTLDLSHGVGVAQYVVQPTGPGEKMLRLFAKHSSGKEYEKILTLQVVKVESSFIGVNTKVWTALQGVGAAIGIPGLLVLVITRVLDARKKKAEDKKPDDGPKIILPK